MLPLKSGIVTTPSTSAPTNTPIDGGASQLLAGSIGYAVRKLRQRRQQ